VILSCALSLCSKSRKKRNINDDLAILPSHDKGPQFAARIMQELNRMLEIESKMSTAFHPQTNRQTKRVNQELEQYLRIFIDYRQEQWPEWLGTAEFAYNNKAHLSTWTLPFKANYRQDSRMGFCKGTP